eukprot:TRINITY_DN11146_c0_g1_i1.p1 TRINITY_DN11146_c0_g1~~TRINITY_DN11146_c0_g1_i1.p1  ORF type:complete len:167 (-),score=46.18 TRINITY_DN11146_c0_g1_i1:50-550(-)
MPLLTFFNATPIKVEGGRDALKLSTSNHKDKYIAIAFVLIGLLVQFAPMDTELFPHYLRWIILLLLVLIAIFNIPSTDTTTISKRERKVTIQSTPFLPFLSTNYTTRSLDDVTEVEVEQLGKKKAYRVVIAYEDGVKVPLTESFYSDEKFMYKISSQVSKFIEKDE